MVYFTQNSESGVAVEVLKGEDQKHTQMLKSKHFYWSEKQQEENKIKQRNKPAHKTSKQTKKQNKTKHKMSTSLEKP